MTLAARINDMHSCPMVTGAVPHVGGTISAGYATVLIGGSPAARRGDTAICAGPIDVLLVGCSTVLIGGSPAARLGDATVHGGRITTGCSTVILGNGEGVSAAKAQSPAGSHLDDDALACLAPPPDLMCVEEEGASEEVGMAPCPTTRPDADDMEGWKPYYGNSSVFHCGYDGILEDRAPTPDNPMNECFYDERGVLVDENHEYADCGGTPDQYSSEADPWDHAIKDEGGIVKAGGPALGESIRHEVNETADQLNDAFEAVSDWLSGDD